MHATRKLVFPSGPIDVTGTFQVESEAISNAGRFLFFCAIPHLEIQASPVPCWGSYSACGYLMLEGSLIAIEWLTLKDIHANP